MVANDTGEEARHTHAVRSNIQAAIRAGSVGLNEVLRRREGADPVLVSRLLAEITQESSAFTCQKPLHRALERNDALVQQWLKREYPRIT
jgi:hypothetical protein